MLKRLWSLIKKELQVQLFDRNSRMMIIMPVFLNVCVFPFAATLEVKNINIGIYNQDSGISSTRLIEQFAGSKVFHKINYLYNERDIKNAIDNQKVLAVVVFQNDFSKNMQSNSPTKLQILMDGRRSNASQIILSYITNIIYRYDISLSVKKLDRPKTVGTNWFNPNLNYKWFVLPSFIAFMATVGCMVVTTMSIAREREQGTFDQLLVSPLTSIYIMIGKMIPAIIISTLQSSVLIFTSIMFYKIHFQGSLLLLYICIICYGFSLSGVGLLISSVCQTQQQALIGIFGFMIPAVLLSGFIAPVENMPEVLQYIAWFNPMSHFLVISKGIYLKGLSLMDTWINLWPLLLMGVTLNLFAYLRFRKYSR
ncbi:ABC transporter permease [Gammaproteobacteria bacterium]|nr:ABC transporter permease [Gammaproteobacteria bacterium]